MPSCPTRAGQTPSSTSYWHQCVATRRRFASAFRAVPALRSRPTSSVWPPGSTHASPVRSRSRARYGRRPVRPRITAPWDRACERCSAQLSPPRRAHRETALATLGRSVGRTAVDTALEGLSTDRLQVAVIGTGRMARVVVERLGELDIVPAVYGRSVERAQRLTQRTAPVRGIDEIPLALRAADVVLCTTSASSHLVTAAEVQAAMRTRAGRRLVVVDLSVPANVEPCTSAISGVRLIDIDDLRDAPRRLIALSSTSLWRRPKRSWRRRCDASTPPAMVVSWVPSSCRCSRVPKRRIDGRFGNINRSWWLTAPSIRWRERSPVATCTSASVDVREAAERDDVDEIERIVRSITADELPAGVTL